MPPVARKFVPELLDQDVPVLQLVGQGGHHLLQTGGILGQVFQVLEHDRTIAGNARKVNPRT